MSAPQVPPRPYSYAEPQRGRQDSLPPPVPPLPPNFHPDVEHQYEEARPHFGDPLVAPRPHKITPEVPANMAAQLNDQASGYADYRGRSPQPPSQRQSAQSYHPGGFVNPARGPSPLPPPQGSQWDRYSPAPPMGNPYNSPPQQGYAPSFPQSPPFRGNAPVDTLSPAMASLSFNSGIAPLHPQHHPRAQSTFGPPAKAPSPPRQAQGGMPALTAALPTVASLERALQSATDPRGDPPVRIAWCRDVLFLVERAMQASGAAPSSGDVMVGPAEIKDPALAKLASAALPVILQVSSPNPMPNPMPVSVAEAIYLRATLEASGAFPDQIRHNPRQAFRDFEIAARGGFSQAWFRLGRDYETFNDVQHARDCFEKGVKAGVESCTYRMGMAHLMGQLGLPASPEHAVPLLHKAALIASIEVPQPAYVYALLLMNDFTHVTVPPQLFAPYLFTPQPPTPEALAAEARKHLERAAFLTFAPAQYKLGHAYEFAAPPFPFDPLLSVQYYSLASQQGEPEADMALSKWFLCGAEGAFEKDEALAYTFAEKAARRQLPSAEFAMGYYAEVGVGGPRDVNAARKWYERAKEHGNEDAEGRLEALNLPDSQALSRQEHEMLTENKLLRKRTQAQQRSQSIDQSNQPPAPAPRQTGAQVVDVIRQNSIDRQRDQSPRPLPTPGAAQAPPSSPPQQSRPSPSRQPQQLPRQNRYTLTDTGAVPNSGPANVYGRAQSPAGRAQGAPPGRRVASVGGGSLLATPPNGMAQPQQPPPPQKTGPTTFAEMGIPTAKAQKEECVIM